MVSILLALTVLLRPTMGKPMSFITLPERIHQAVLCYE